VAVEEAAAVAVVAIAVVVAVEAAAAAVVVRAAVVVAAHTVVEVAEVHMAVEAPAPTATTKSFANAKARPKLRTGLLLFWHPLRVKFSQPPISYVQRFAGCTHTTLPARRCYRK